MRKKSAGSGRRNAQRRQYSRKAKSNSSRPSTVSRSTLSAVAGFAYALGPSRRTLSELVMIGSCVSLVM